MARKAILFAEVKQQGWDAALALAKGYVTIQAKFEAAKEKLANTWHDASKVIAAMQVMYAELQDALKLPRGLSFREYYKTQLGQYPNNHHETGAGAFRVFVLGGLIEEEAHFDKASADALMAAYTIAKKLDFKMEHPTILEVAEELKDRADGYGKRIKAMKAEATGKGGNADGEGADAADKAAAEVMKGLTVAMLISILKTAFSTGLTGTVFAELQALIGTAAKLQPEAAEALWNQTCDLSIAWNASGVTKELISGWMKSRTQRTKAATAAAKIVAATPETPKPELVPA